MSKPCAPFPSVAGYAITYICCLCPCPACSSFSFFSLHGFNGDPYGGGIWVLPPERTKTQQTANQTTQLETRATLQTHQGKHQEPCRRRTQQAHPSQLDNATKTKANSIYIFKDSDLGRAASPAIDREAILHPRSFYTTTARHLRIPGLLRPRTTFSSLSTTTVQRRTTTTSNHPRICAVIGA